MNIQLDDNLYLGIDLGLNNFVTTVDNSGNQPFIINGKAIKSINQFYNKKLGKLKSFVGDLGTSNRIKKLTHKRNCKIEDYLHKTSRYIVNYCIKNRIKNIVIGKNDNWKNKINIGKRNNQYFVQIPHAKLIDKIIYKAEEVGINVILTEESYTSKCDSLSLEKISKHKKYNGKRIKRGLFQSNTKKLINADVNGAINILRKLIDDSLISGIINRGFVFNPIKLNFNKDF